MKRRYLIGTALALVLAYLAGMGWKNHRREDRLLRICAALEAEAAALPGGVDGDSSNRNDNPRHREAKTAVDIPALAARLLEAFSATAEAGRYGRDDDALRLRFAAVKAEVARLSGSELAALIDECGGITDMPFDIRMEARYFAYGILSQKDPDIFLKEALKEKANVNDLRLRSITRNEVDLLASRDVYAAADWLRRMQEIPALKLFIPDGLGSIATRDPELAFSLLKEFAPALAGQDGGGVLNGQALAYSATDPAGQAKMIQLAREFIDSQGMTDGNAKAFVATFALRMSFWNYSDCSAALAEMSPQDRALVAWNLRAGTRGVDPGPWLDWMVQQLPQDRAEEKLRVQVVDWGRRDAKSASAWLQQMPAGPVRDTVVDDFVVRMVETIPEKTAQLALSVSTDAQREELLGNVMRRWSRVDRNAAAEFARSNGITLPAGDPPATTPGNPDE